MGVPFTPVTGNRILLNTDFRKQLSKSQVRTIRKVVSLYLKRLSNDNQMSSVHINFAREEEIRDIAGPIFTKQQSATTSIKNGTDYLHRTSIQYHWYNVNPSSKGQPYRSFEEYLSCFRSKRRIAVKRERERVKHEEGIQVDAIVGREILEHEGLVDRLYDIYVSTIDKLYFGKQYLTLDFFHLLTQSSFVDNLCFMCARRISAPGKSFHAKDVIAGTFNCVKDGVFYGRYWGTLEEVKYLHFETCYWAAIEFCIDQGLVRMEPGAGGSDYKFSRGFVPTIVHSAHYIRHPRLRRAIGLFIQEETFANMDLKAFLERNSVIQTPVLKSERGKKSSARK